jgi:ATP-dependent protease HslVU (ClpYQ) peptidase subunit
MAADGQVTLAKRSSRAERGRSVDSQRLRDRGICRRNADAFTLLSKFETKIGEYQGQLDEPPLNWKGMADR